METELILEAKKILELSEDVIVKSHEAYAARRELYDFMNEIFTERH